LRNLGLLVLVHVAPDTMDTVFVQLDRQPGLSLSTVEIQILGLDHADAGAELASAWQLPAALAATMGPLGKPSGSDELTTLVSLLVLCKRIRQLLRDTDDIAQDPELQRILADLGVDFDAWPPLLSQWHECTVDIGRLAMAFTGAGR